MCKCVIYTPHCNYLVLKYINYTDRLVSVACHDLLYIPSYICMHLEQPEYTCWTLALVCTTFHSNAHTKTHIYIYIYIYIMCPPGYHHDGFVATYALGHMMYNFKHLLWCTSPQILHVERFCHVYNAAQLFFEFPTCRTNIYFFTIQ